MVELLAELFRTGGGKLVKGNWWQFLVGYLLIAAAFGVCIFVLIEIVAKRHFEIFSSQHPYFALGSIAVGALSIAGLSSAALMKVHLADPNTISIKPLWNAKLRALRDLHTLIESAEGTLKKAVLEESRIPGPLPSFAESVDYAFNRLSHWRSVSNDIACDGTTEARDKECKDILDKMEGLQAEGQKLVALANLSATGTLSERAETIRIKVNEVLKSIEKLDGDARQVMKKKRLLEGD